MKYVFIIVAFLGLTMGFAKDEILFSPIEKIEGQSLAAWSEQWYVWLNEVPREYFPTADSTGAGCALNQTRDVWFLAGTIENGTLVERTCIIPFGKPILGSFITANMICPFFDSELNFLDKPKLISLSVDSFSYNINVMKKYRVRMPCGKSKVNPEYGFDGYFFAIKPLEKGEHTIELRISVDKFVKKVNYFITVI